MGCRGAGRRKEARGVLDVARDLIVATLVVAGVTPTPVERREQGRSREEEVGLGPPVT
jgi:hypothetical protein